MQSKHQLKSEAQAMKMSDRIRKFTIIAATVICFAGCKDQRVTDLEKRVNGLEQSVKQLQTEREAAQVKAATATLDDEDRRRRLQACVAQANAAFDKDLRNNGTKRDDGNGYDVPVPVLEQMQRQKQVKIEECRLLYSK